MMAIHSTISRVWLPSHDNGVVGGWSERQSQESMANHAKTIVPIGDSQEAEKAQLYAICHLSESPAAPTSCNSTPAKNGDEYYLYFEWSTFVYLSVIRDLFNNEIVAWQLSKRNDVQLVLDAVEQWTQKRDGQAVEEYMYNYNYRRL